MDKGKAGPIRNARAQTPAQTSLAQVKRGTKNLRTKALQDQGQHHQPKNTVYRIAMVSPRGNIFSRGPRDRVPLIISPDIERREGGREVGN